MRIYLLYARGWLSLETSKVIMVGSWCGWVYGIYSTLLSGMSHPNLGWSHLFLSALNVVFGCAYVMIEAILYEKDF